MHQCRVPPHSPLSVLFKMAGRFLSVQELTDLSGFQCSVSSRSRTSNRSTLTWLFPCHSNRCVAGSKDWSGNRVQGSPWTESSCLPEPVYRINRMRSNDRINPISKAVFPLTINRLPRCVITIAEENECLKNATQQAVSPAQAQIRHFEQKVLSIIYSMLNSKDL